MFDYEIIEKDNTIRITAYHGGAKAEVPDTINGTPVTEIGPYAFSRTEIILLDLPRTVRRLGRYALYGCAKLKEFRFCSTLNDIGAGAFTGCHKIEKICIDVTEDERSHLRDVLMEIPEELVVEYRQGSRTAILPFPEYYEEGVENTPARIIMSEMHGSGLLYRNCFTDRRLRFSEYDGRFPYALGQEHPSFLYRLALARLMYPYELSENAKKAYETFLKENISQALDYFTAHRDQTAVGFLMQLNRKQRDIRRIMFEL